MGIATEIVKALCTDTGKTFVKNVATGVLSIMVAKAIVDTGKVNRRMLAFERDLDRAEATIDSALGRGRRRERYSYDDDDEDEYRYSRERDREYRYSRRDDTYSDERPTRRERRDERYRGRRR